MRVAGKLIDAWIARGLSGPMRQQAREILVDRERVAGGNIWEAMCRPLVESEEDPKGERMSEQPNDCFGQILKAERGRSVRCLGYRPSKRPDPMDSLARDRRRIQDQDAVRVLL